VVSGPLVRSPILYSFVYSNTRVVYKITRGTALELLVWVSTETQVVNPLFNWSGRTLFPDFEAFESEVERAARRYAPRRETFSQFATSKWIKLKEEWLGIEPKICYLQRHGYIPLGIITSCPVSFFRWDDQQTMLTLVAMKWNERNYSYISELWLEPAEHKQYIYI